MLLNKQDTPYIRVFKLGSGEEFIGKVVSETVVSYNVSKPMCLVPTEKGLQFAPFMMLADQSSEVVIPKPVIYSAPADSLTTQYESVTSGIALPKKSAILT